MTSVYALAFGGLLLTCGRAGDIFGRRRMFVAGVALFTLTSLLGGLAQSPLRLVIMRAGQGAGAAVASPAITAAITALVSSVFPAGPRRARAMGLITGLAGAGGGIGLLLGGVLVSLVSWRAVLFVNIPIGLAVIVLAPRVLPEVPRRDGRLDPPVAVTVTAALAILVYGLTSPPPTASRARSPLSRWLSPSRSSWCSPFSSGGRGTRCRPDGCFAAAPGWGAT